LTRNKFYYSYVFESGISGFSSANINLLHYPGYPMNAKAMVPTGMVIRD